MSDSAMPDSDPVMSDQGPITIVLAEDEAIIRLDLRETLEEEGYQVIGETSRGDQALELVRQMRPDVAILDVKMPGTDGITVAGQIRDEMLCAVLLLTAFSQRELIARAADAGALAYLVQTFERAGLVSAVEMSLARFQDMTAYGEELLRVESRLEARKAIDRAKGRLMDNRAMSEDAAYGFIQKQSMTQRRSMESVAEEIIHLTPQQLTALVSASQAESASQAASQAGKEGE